MEDYYSCHYIQNGINFYPNNIIKICCFSPDSDVDICTVNENIDNIVQMIVNKKKQMIEDFIRGDVYASCKNCPSLIKGQWGDSVEQIRSITFNHFVACNLRCQHCGNSNINLKGPNKLRDTDHYKVLNIVQNLIQRNITSKDLCFDVGGGEPSLSKGLIEIVKYCIENKHKVHINSNGANYVQLFADGVNEGLIQLTLTPDAGSKEVYENIKGRDFFNIVWANIENYMLSCKQGVLVKFILESGNVHDIDNMVNMCIKGNVKEVILNLDINLKPEDFSNYIPYINRFRTLCKNNSIIVHRGPFISSDLWSDNIDLKKRYEMLATIRMNLSKMLVLIQKTLQDIRLQS